MVEKRGRKRIEIKNIDAEEIIRKNVKAHGNGGRVMAPKHWVGRDIFLVLPWENKDLRFVEYLAVEAQRLLEIYESGRVKPDDMMLLESMYPVFTTLFDLFNEYDIPAKLEAHIDTLLIKMSEILKNAGYIGVDDD